jgi:hypothetical protein
MGKVFSRIWAAMALFAFVAAIVADARHQFVLAGICAALAVLMWPWKENHKAN